MAGLFHAWISEYFKKMGVAPILQRRKLRHREVKWCRQSYAGKLVTCLRLEYYLIIPQVPLLIFSSRLHLFTMPLSHSFSSLQNNAQSLQHRKIVLSTLEIPPVSQVSEPYKHLHVYHCFETLLCSPTMLSPYTEEHTAVALGLCCTSQIHPNLARACPAAFAQPFWNRAHPQPGQRGPEAGTDMSWAQTLLLAPGSELLLDSVVRAAHTVPGGAAATLQAWKDLSCFHTWFCQPVPTLPPLCPQPALGVPCCYRDGIRHESG